MTKSTICSAPSTTARRRATSSSPASAPHRVRPVPMARKAIARRRPRHRRRHPSYRRLERRRSSLNSARRFPDLDDRDQAETDRLLEHDRRHRGQESQCGWCRDKWGISRQITRGADRCTTGQGRGVAAKRAFDAMIADDRRRRHRSAVRGAEAEASTRRRDFAQSGRRWRHEDHRRVDHASGHRRFVLALFAGRASGAFVGGCVRNALLVSLLIL